ncbi:MAG: murein biosynthesis integral membrane protein MurJ [Victivallaceae bacterium]
MSSVKKNIFSGAAATSFAIFLSRILGLVRVTMEASILGGGALASAWFLAFSIPNLFRRLLGEGALGNAVIAIYSHLEKEHGEAAARKQLPLLFVILGGVLAVIAIAIGLGAIILRNYFIETHEQYVLLILPTLICYTIFICIIGVSTALLSIRRVFFLPALGSVLLNVFIIGGLYFSRLIAESDPAQTLFNLTYAVLWSGLIQLLLMGILMVYYRIFPIFKGALWRSWSFIKEVCGQATYTIIGSSSLQIGFLVDRLIASSLGAFAIPALTFSDRYIDLPIGMIAVAITTVLMADLSRSAAEKDYVKMAEAMNYCLRQILFMTIPVAAFTFIFREPLFRLLLMSGNFTAENLQATTYVVLFYAPGIPLFCTIKILTPMFLSRKLGRTPMWVSIGCIIFNIIMNFILMYPLAAGGIALATVLSSLANNSILAFLLWREGFEFQWSRLVSCALKALAASLAAGLLYLIYNELFQAMPFTFWRRDMLPLTLVGGAFGLAYLGISFLLRSYELKETLEIVLGRFHRKRRSN